MTLTVDLGADSYPILIGGGLLREPGRFAAGLRGRSVVVVSDSSVAPLYMRTLVDSLSGLDKQVDRFLLPAGESSKTLDNYASLLDFLLTRGHNRDVTLVALGGGVVGDLTGFAAASYQRGVGFLQVPTTLLAQVDSSVGGKTAVNHPLGKNMIGAFYQPDAVVIDTQTLATLPEREYLAGLAEVIKYGVIDDPQLFAFMESYREAILARDAQALAHIIGESCRIKAKVVAADEREQGVRAILNYGHTFGHALENLAGYGTVLHGEAVAIGMVQAADYSLRIGRLRGEHALRIKRLIGDYGLPVAPPAELGAERRTEDLVQKMLLDKKTLDSRIRLVLASQIGEVDVMYAPDQEALRSTLRAGDALCEAGAA
ncbi:MAG: 3-dehydroquinate synthase [Pseudomonadota bacterium]